MPFLLSYFIHQLISICFLVLFFTDKCFIFGLILCSVIEKQFSVCSFL